MKCLSLWQPWASLLVLGIKTIETRHWFTRYRGPLLIHAAKRPITKEEQEYFFGDAFADVDEDVFFGTRFAKGLEPLPYGAIVGMVNLEDCIKTDDIGSKTLQRTANWNWYECELGNFAHGRFAWVTNKQEIFDTPIPYRGMQGLFEVKEYVGVGKC